MNISLLDRFTCYKNYYQIMYFMVIFSIIIVLILEMLLFNNITSLNYKGIVSKNNNLVISGLDYLEAGMIIDSKRLEIDNKKMKYKVLGVDEGVNDYTLKLKLDAYYLDTKTLNIKVIIKEENLWQFMVRKMKGE